jgi:pyruvate dehydrogenase complex dehydrogenase (E1) component
VRKLTDCFFETAVLDTENEASYSTSVASLFTMFKLRAAASQQLMGQLPLTRVTVTRPFVNAGIDYVGPFEIRSGNTRSKTTTKCYVALFICIATKAIHLELVSNLTSEAFIAALKRFIARRGLIEHLYSDKGSNFVGANRELKAFFRSEEFSQQVHNYAEKTQFQ